MATMNKAKVKRYIHKLLDILLESDVCTNDEAAGKVFDVVVGLSTAISTTLTPEERTQIDEIIERRLDVIEKKTQKGSSSTPMVQIEESKKHLRVVPFPDNKPPTPSALLLAIHDTVNNAAKHFNFNFASILVGRKHKNEVDLTTLNHFSTNLTTAEIHYVLGVIQTDITTRFDEEE